MRVRNTEIRIVRDDVAACGAMSGEINEWTVREGLAVLIHRAREQGRDTVTLPALGISGGFPPVACAKIMSQEVLRAAREETGVLREIVIAIDGRVMVELFEKQVYGYLRHVMEDMAWGPYVTTDIIIEIHGGIVLIERSNPPFGLALPGGFVDRGEALETAARREAKEETSLDLEDLQQLHTYSDPKRDPRFHTVTTVFYARGVGDPKAGDDAKGLQVIPFSRLRTTRLAFDHNQVIEDYLCRISRV